MPFVRNTNSTVAIRIVTVIFAVIAGIILLHLAFVLLEANTGNPFVEFIRGLANWFSWLFKDMFTVDDEKLRAVVNYGLAALAYLLLGGLIRGFFLRRAV